MYIYFQFFLKLIFGLKESLFMMSFALYLIHGLILQVLCQKKLVYFSTNKSILRTQRISIYIDSKVHTIVQENKAEGSVTLCILFAKDADKSFFMKYIEIPVRFYRTMRNTLDLNQ